MSRRPGLGNFRITFDPALDDPKKGKEVNRRFDGEGLDEVKDPRLEMSAEILKRGRGPAKNRTELQELEYTVSLHLMYVLMSSGTVIPLVLNPCRCLALCSLPDSIH